MPDRHLPGPPPAPEENRTGVGIAWLLSDMTLVTGMTVLGIESILGRPGIGVAALLIVFLGNPLSGLTSAPEMLPTPWGAIGQLLPPGATGTLLRNVGFFDGAATLTPILVLLGWLALGTVLLILSQVRDRKDPAIELVAS